MINANSERIAEAVARAKAALAERAKPKELTYGQQRMAEAAALAVKPTFQWNAAQQRAIDLGMSGKSFCLIGSAGTGKTTTLKGLLTAILRGNGLPALERGTKHLRQGAPGVVLFSYTRRAVRNIAKQMPVELQGHCITGHKLLEFAPETFEVDDGKGGVRNSLRFVPTRDRHNPLPSSLRLVIVDESSMVATDFFDFVLDALPNRHNVQFIFLGDLHQLPPVYGDAILGHKLLELPIVELTEVYRQALESPIIDIALQIKDGKIRDEFKVILKDTIIETPRGKVTLHPWKTKLDQEEGMFAMQRFFRTWVREGKRPNQKPGEKNDPLDFENDVILCAWNKSFGNIELNNAIATELAILHEREVYEVIAGYNKRYFSVGDRVLHEKRDAIITRIVRNTRYIGKQPQYQSATMDYWGYSKQPSIALNQSLEDIEAMLDTSMIMDGAIEDRTHEGSHILYLRYVDEQGSTEDTDTLISSASEINGTELAYCMSVHKSQGSEWKRVIFVTHGCHQKMLSRELIYTAITRASQELYIFMESMMLTKASNQARIKGITLEDKLKFFAIKAKERAAQQLLTEEEEE